MFRVAGEDEVTEVVGIPRASAYYSNPSGHARQPPYSPRILDQFDTVDGRNLHSSEHRISTQSQHRRDRSGALDIPR